jgi:hypothetical protein
MSSVDSTPRNSQDTRANKYETTISTTPGRWTTFAQHQSCRQWQRLSLLAYTWISGELVMEPGPVEVSAGSSSGDIRSNAKFTVARVSWQASRAWGKHLPRETICLSVPIAFPE